MAAVVAASLAAAAVVVGAAALGGDEPGRQLQPRAGLPPLSLQLGVRTDAEARDLRRAAQLYGKGRRAQARTVFARYDSLEARVGALLTDWPGDSLDRLERLATLHPRSGVVQLNLGLARLWAAKGDPRQAWRRAVERAPDTPYAVTASDLLHPEFARGVPIYVPRSPAPAEIAELSPPRQFAALRARATRSVADRLLYGVALQRLGRARSAEQVYAEAAKLAPDDPDTQTAAAVGRFTKDDPSRAFSRLGPLTQRFPHAATVRFHLGLLLLWTGQVKEAKKQLKLASAERGDPLARQAERFLARLP